MVPGWKSLLLVKTHLTVSPGSSLNVAVRVDRFPVLGLALLPSLQTMEVRAKRIGDGSASVEVYVPGTRLETVIVPLSAIVPAAVPVKVKLPGAPLGFVCFSTMIVPRLVLVKVQMTFSPGSSAMLAVRVPKLVVPLVSLQVNPVRSQPITVPSVTE